MRTEVNIGVIDISLVGFKAGTPLHHSTTFSQLNCSRRAVVYTDVPTQVTPQLSLPRPRSLHSKMLKGS